MFINHKTNKLWHIREYSNENKLSLCVTGMNFTHTMSRERSPIQKNMLCIVLLITSSKTFLISGLEMRIVVTYQRGNSRVVSGVDHILS